MKISLNASKSFSVVLLSVAAALTITSCKPTPVVPPTPDPDPVIELVAPADGTACTLTDDGTISFEWTPVEGINSYKLKLCLTDDFATGISILATGNPLVFQDKDFDARMNELGIAGEATSDVYWTIVPGGHEAAENKVRKLTVTRLSDEPELPYEQRIADPITVKVAILYEDPIIPDTDGKRMHEVCTVGGRGGRWYDPRKQCKQFEANLEEASHGVIQYEVVKEVEADRFFTYCDSTARYVTIDDLLVLFSNGNPVPGIGEGYTYDYAAMCKYYGFGKMRDDGEINEVWVYTHPGSGMYESRMIGQGAFWLNSPGLTDTSVCTELLNVMFCNYERTVDLALHSYGHRYESIMREVYGRWSYEYANKASALNNWELYSAYGIQFEKFDKGYSHVGNVHFPPNGKGDYDYSNSSQIYTYADEWFDYPKMKFDKSEARKITSSEWNRDQQGYMMWWFGHMPHFKGLNPDEKDLHLNNWWYYVVDYNAALRYERQLQSEL